METISNTIDTMSHREKLAWWSLGALLAAFGPYLVWMSLSPPAPTLPGLGTMKLFAIAAGGQVALLGAGYFWLRVRSPDDARAPADERDRAISLRSISSAFYVLIVGLILVGIVMPFNKEGWDLINTAVAVLVLTQLVQHGVAVWCYRRGTHG